MQANGDIYRGDVLTDDNDNVYVASSTNSEDFPVTSSIGPTYGGGVVDGLAFSLNADLSELRWSTYLGGVADDAAYSFESHLSCRLKKRIPPPILARSNVADNFF